MGEKYFELGNPAKNVLAKLNNIKEPQTWSQIKKTLSDKISNDKILKTGIDQLIESKLIKKEKSGKKIVYKLNKRFMNTIFVIGRKQSDKINLESFGLSEIINLNTIRSKTTVYGLKSEVFNKSTDNRELDINKKETLNFAWGIKANELMGEFFGVPLGIKIQAKREKLNEKDIIEKSADYHIWNYKLGEEKLSDGVKKKIKNLVMGVIMNHRNNQIRFEEAGENVTKKLLELKKEHRYEELEKTYKQEIKKIKQGATKRILTRFKEEFLKIVNSTDISKAWLERAIFEFHGVGFGAFSSFNEKRFDGFARAIYKLKQKEKKEIIDFLMKVFEQNMWLYPTQVSFMSRAHSIEFVPDIAKK